MQKLWTVALLAAVITLRVPAPASAQMSGLSWDAAAPYPPYYGHYAYRYAYPVAYGAPGFGGYYGGTYYGYAPGYDSYGYVRTPYRGPRRAAYASAAPFDGTWGAVAETTRGHCENIQFGLAINEGRIYSAGGAYGGYAAQLGGRVSRSGSVRVMAMAGPRAAYGVGRLGLYQGGGTWAGRGPSGACSGVWTAYRS
jgi:hypothetical protein